MTTYAKIIQNGITLIALVISIIVMLILAGVSINAVVGDNGILSRTQYATFINEMTAVEEAVQMWKAGEIIDAQGEDTKAIPTNGMCKVNDISNIERLTGEIGYYRNWSISKSMPEISILTSAEIFNSEFSGEFIFYPAGVQDLYYLNNDAIGIKGNKTYLIDAATGMIYSMTGIGLKGVTCYSKNMANAVMNGNSDAPIFAEAIVSGSGSDETLAGNTEAEYGFQIIADVTNNNIYKLYNNGDLYGKGIKGNLLNTNVNKMQEINPYVWSKMTVPTNIANPIEIVPGEKTIFVIDENKDLWAWGDNGYNRLGLTEKEQNEYTGREAVKLNIYSKKVYKVIPNKNSVWVITEDDELYACGENIYGGLGIGEISSQSDAFKKVNFLNPKGIKKIITGNGNGNRGTIILMEDGKIFFAGNTGSLMSTLFSGTELEASNLTEFIQIFNEPYGIPFENNIVDISQYADWGQNRTVWLDDKGNLYEMPNNGKYIKVDTNVSKISSIQNGVLIFERRTETNEVQYKINTINSTSWISSIGITPDKNEYVDITEYLNGFFDVKSVKDFCIVGGNSIFFLLNNGEVYVFGNNNYLGINRSSGISDGIISLKSEVNIDNIESFIYSSNVDAITSVGTFMLKDREGKYYATGNAELIFRNAILEGSWSKMNPEGVRVKKFNAQKGFNDALGFIDDNNDIWILGNNVTSLGINHSTDDLDLNNFVRLKDYLKDIDGTEDENGISIFEHIDGKVADYSFQGDSFYLMTNEEDNNTLYVSGKYEVTGWTKYSYSGLNEDAYIPTKLLENVKEFFATATTGRIALLKNGDLYIWGINNGYDTASIVSKTPVLYQTSSIKNTEIIEDGIEHIYMSGCKSYIITQNSKELYGAGLVRVADYAMGLDTSAITYQLISKEKYFNNEMIVDIQGISGGAFFKTENGNVYACGNKKYLGIGSSSLDQQFIPKQLFDKEDVLQLAVGPSWAVVIKKDGSVWGTGTNIYGILGRWAGTGRGDSNSRYKTAFNWVECPELEI